MRFLSCLPRAAALAIVLLAGTAGPPSRAQDSRPAQDNQAAQDSQAAGDSGEAAESRSEADSLFGRTATALEAGNVSPRTLEQLRAQLVEVRDSNGAIAARGNLRASILDEQLKALGPPLADGGKEAEEIAARRQQLTDAIAEANAPVRRANETHAQAAFLIRQVDGQLRSMQFDRLLERSPTPLLPTTWSSGLHDVRQFWQRLRRDLASELERPSVSMKLNRTVPLAIGLALFGILFLTVLQHPISRALKRFCNRPAEGVKALVLALVYNASFIVLPTIGALALIAVFPVLDIYPNAVRTGLLAVPAMAFFVIIANWLGHTLFAPGQSRWRLLDLGDRDARLGLRLCQGLGVFIALQVVVEASRTDNAFGPAAVSVLSVPPIVLAAVLLWVLAGIIRSKQDGTVRSEVSDPDGEEVEEASVKPQESGFLLFLSLLMKTSAVLAVCVTLAGYVELARIAIIPVIMTVAQLGVGFLLYHLVLALFRTALGRGEDVPPPVLLSIVLITILVLVFAPLIALSWGARGTDIIEVWRLLTGGVQFGDVRLSLESFVVLVIVFALGLGITRWLQNLLKVTVLPQTRMDTGARNAVVTGTGYVGLTLASLIAVSTAGLNLSSLAVVAGALSVGIGFGLQTVVSNFVSGIILLIERPIKEGDWIEVSGESGYVRKISVRSTRIETFDRHDVIIPNSDLIAGTVKNMTLSSKSGRLILPVGVAYGSDLEKVKAILLDAARAHPTIARYPFPVVLFTGLGDSALNFELRCYLKDIHNILTTKSDLYLTVYNELGKAGVEIPFPQRDLHLKDIDRLVDALERRGGKGQQEAPADTPRDS
jgi:potassium efflux system protein